MRIYLICLMLSFSSASAEAVVIDFEPGWEDDGFGLSVFAGGPSGRNRPLPMPWNLGTSAEIPCKFMKV